LEDWERQLAIEIDDELWNSQAFYLFILIACW
jgi:hypothetical protein